MKSRVPLVGFIAVILLYWMALPVIAVSFINPEIASFPSDTLFLNLLQDAVFTMFLVIPLFFSRMFFIGSDLENLLVAGVSRWKLTGGIFFFIVFLVSPLILIIDRVMLIIPLSYNIPPVFMGLETLLLYFIFILIAMLAIVLGFDKSLLAVFLISLLNFSNILGNPFSMGNAETSLYLWGVFASIAVLFSVLVTLFISISKQGYAPYRIVRKRRRELVTNPLNFSGKKSEKSSFWLGFLMTFTTTVNNNSARGPRYGRIRTKRAFSLLVLVNIILAGGLIYLFNLPFGSTNGFTGDIALMYASFFTALTVWSMVSLSLSQERIWLLGSTIGETRFMRNHVLSKSFLFTLLMIPSLIPLLGMAIIGHPLFLKLGLILSLTLVTMAFPASVLGLYISGFLLPEQYVRNEMPPTGSLSFFVISLPLIFSLVAGFVSYFYIPFLAVSAGVMYVLAIFFLINNGFNQKVFHSLVLRRFI